MDQLSKAKGTRPFCKQVEETWTGPLQLCHGAQSGNWPTSLPYSNFPYVLFLNDVFFWHSHFSYCLFPDVSNCWDAIQRMYLYWALRMQRHMCILVQIYYYPYTIPPGFRMQQKANCSSDVSVLKTLFVCPEKFLGKIKPKDPFGNVSHEFELGWMDTPDGNILWDCISLLDEATVDIINALGGLKAIAISHPHYYATNAVWSATFGNVPVYIHERFRL